jgi:hypothetical protein
MVNAHNMRLERLKKGKNKESRKAASKIFNPKKEWGLKYTVF